MAKVIPTLIYDPARDMWMARTPYHVQWINDFKYQVAASARTWDKPLKVWFYDPMFHDCVKTLCDIHFGGYQEKRPEAPPPPPPPIHNGSGVDAHFREFIILCDREALKKMYRTSAMRHHPDTGGDPKKMTDLNMCWAKICKELGIS